MTDTARDTARSVLDALSDVTTVLQSDGADLRVLDVSADEAFVELELAFDDVSCLECVLPPDRLYDMIVSGLERRVGHAVTVVLHDPRTELTTVGGGLPTRVEVLDPTAVAEDNVADAGPGPDAGPLRGKTVAIRMDVLWRSFDWTIEEWTKSLEAAGAKVVTWRRVQGQVGADYAVAQAEYEAMLAEADVLISGLGNCGSCTSWSIRDALSGSARGIPTIGVVTGNFEQLGRVLARDGGYPALRLHVLPYPFDPLTEPEIRQHARDAFIEVVQELGATV